jgi:hypothetical protein
MTVGVLVLSAAANEPNAAVRFPILKKRPIVTPVQLCNAGHPSSLRLRLAGTLSEGQSPSTSSTNATKLIENSPRNKESQMD